MSNPTRFGLAFFTFIFWSILIYSCVATRKGKDAVRKRAAELRDTQLFQDPTSGRPLLEAETALLALESPFLRPDAQKAHQTNLEALLRLCR